MPTRAVPPATDAPGSAEICHPLRHVELQYADYDEESFFARHCYFTGGNDPYKRLKTALKADIDIDAWASLNRTQSRPFAKPVTGKIAVKVINDYGAVSAQDCLWITEWKAPLWMAQSGA